MKRTHAGLALPLLLAFGAAGCETDQPLEEGLRNAGLTFSGTGASVASYRLYQLFEDSEDPDGDGFPDGDGNPDDIDGDGNPDFSPYCVNREVPVTPLSAPWPFSIEVKILRAGSIAPQTIVSAISPPDFSDPAARNLSAYDTGGGTESVPLPNVFVAFNPRSCVVPNLPRCEVDSDCGVAGFPPAAYGCVDKGTCTGDPDLVCHDLVTSGQCPQTPGALCDCEAMGKGLCCTEELYGTDPNCAADVPEIGDTAGLCIGDLNTGCVPSCSQLGAGSCDTSKDVEKRFSFVPLARVLSAVHGDLLAAGSNFIADLDPTFAPTDDPPGGVCPGQDLGAVGIQGGGLPFPLQLNKGDTLIVQGRRFSNAPPGITFNTAPAVRVDLFLEGAQVSPEGSTSTGVSSDGAINFTFTAR